MAKTLVTAEAVAHAAEQLSAAGQEPTLIAVQAVLQGGSFTTVKRFLDVWKAERAQLAALVVPPALAQAGAELIARVWQQATTTADAALAQARADAQAGQATLAQALEAAETTISRLESEQEQSAAQLADLQAQLAQAREQAQAGQAAQLAAAPQAGELAALRDVVARLMPPAA